MHCMQRRERAGGGRCERESSASNRVNIVYDQIWKTSQDRQSPFSAGENRTDLEQTVPATGTQGDTIAADAQAADSVIVSCQHADPLALEGIPHIDIVVVVAGKQDSARSGERDRGDAAENVVVCVRVEFAVGSQIEQLARSVVGAGRKCVPVGEEPGTGSALHEVGGVIILNGKKKPGNSLNSVDIGLVSCERLDGFASSDVPDFSSGITSTRHEKIGVGSERDAISCVSL